jgi:kinesin family protein 15
MSVHEQVCSKHWNEFVHAQVLNDLLDPSRANLKLREDPKRGFYVEGIKEETLVSAEHALSVIATGIAHRKV